MIEFRNRGIPLFFTVLCLLAGTFSFSASASELTKTADAGIAYQNSLLFLGESTTAHLKNRGVLTGGKNTEQVLCDESGTMLLSAKILSQTIPDPKNGMRYTISEEIGRLQPKILVLSFGLNGILNHADDPSRFLKNYRALIEAIHKASPDTRVILQSVYPVCAPDSRFEWAFSVTPDEINEKIASLNEKIRVLTDGYDFVRYADTASVLRDDSGGLAPENSVGDGIHLTAGAYRDILGYLRTHAWKER